MGNLPVGLEKDLELRRRLELKTYPRPKPIRIRIFDSYFTIWQLVKLFFWAGVMVFLVWLFVLLGAVAFGL